MIFPRNVLKEIKQYLQSPEAVILTGMRRTGKTTILNFIQESSQAHWLAASNAGVMG